MHTWEECILLLLGGVFYVCLSGLIPFYNFYILFIQTSFSWVFFSSLSVISFSSLNIFKKVDLNCLVKFHVCTSLGLVSINFYFYQWAIFYYFFIYFTILLKTAILNTVYSNSKQQILSPSQELIFHCCEL